MEKFRWNSYLKLFGIVHGGNCPRKIIPETNMKELNTNGGNKRSEYFNGISAIEK
jgi:uncharacterized Zn-finger protein